MSGEKEWTVEDVMEYFGKYLDNDEGTAKELMVIVREKEISNGFRFYSYTFNQKMRVFRQFLVDKGINIPYSSGYRRAK